LHMLRICLFTAIALATLSACTESGTSIIQDKQIYTVEDQKMIGNQLSASMQADAQAFDLLNANAYPEVTTYLETMLNSAVISEHVLNRPSSGDHSEGFDWEIITMIDDEEAFAFSRNIAIGNTDDDASELIYFLKDQIFTEEQMLAADRRTVDVMCPFNYDVTSLMTLIERTTDMGQWQTKRPRPQNWQEMLLVEFENCENDSNEKFRSRYLEMISTLP